MEVEDWYQSLLEDCMSIMVEAGFVSRWSTIEGYHMLGERILTEVPNFERRSIYGQEIVQRVADSLGKSTRTIYYAMKFVTKFPDINALPAGKHESWHRVVNKYLPDNPTSREPVCKHCEIHCAHHA